MLHEQNPNPCSCGSMTAEMMRNDSALTEAPLQGNLFHIPNQLSKKPTSPLRELITSGESQTLEFKSTFDKACIESLAAFANAHGGAMPVAAVCDRRSMLSLLCL